MTPEEYTLKAIAEAEQTERIRSICTAAAYMSFVISMFTAIAFMFWIESTKSKHTIQAEAVIAGVGEYVTDENGKPKFQWIKK